MTRTRSTLVMAGLALAAGRGVTAAPAQAVTQTRPATQQAVTGQAATVATFPPPCRIDRSLFRLTSPNQVEDNNVSICDAAAGSPSRTKYRQTNANEGR